MSVDVRARVRRLQADGNRSSIVLAGGLVIAGFVTLAVTWKAVADRLEVPLQLPYLVSGGFTGIAVVAAGLAMINVQVTRRINARRRDQLDHLLDAATAVAARLADLTAEGDAPRR